MIFRSAAKPTWLLVFLGNPGTKYAGTRHNAGFMTADVMEKRFNIRINRLKFKALTAAVKLGSVDVLLMKPQTFMNLSGDAVSQAMRFYKISTDHILVFSDDMSLPTGKLRIRRSGSAGGHNGLKDIIAKCGGDGFPRIKIGVGAPPDPEYSVVDWVLGSFSGKDADLMAEAVTRAAEAAEVLVNDGIDAAMAKFN